MTTRHHISRADEIYAGAARFERYASSRDGRDGLIAHFPILHEFGAPLALDADGLITGATGAELPNSTTTTYTTDDDGSSPFDNAATPAPSTIVDSLGNTVSVWALDVPRNVTAAVTHASSVVAMTIVVTGYDVYRQKMIEQFDITATGTSKSDAGLKAFAYIESYAITSAGNATANTLNMGWGDVLGLPFRIDAKHRVIPIGNGALDASATIVVADDTDPATATTGDVRGTIDFNTAANGTVQFACWIMPERDTKVNAFGVAQYSG